MRFASRTDRPPDVPSPCINICEIDGVSGLCRGCLRTLAEIAAWPELGEASKREIVNRVQARRDSSGNIQG